MGGRVSFLAAAAVMLGPGLAAAQEAPEDVGRSAEWVLAVEDFGRAEAAIRSALQALGGYVSDREVARAESGERVTLVLRVSAGALDSFLDEVRKVGTVAREETRARDPTPEYARINSRLVALEAAERDLREQMSFLAPDEPLALDLQREVAAARADRMAMLARRTLLDERVQYAVTRVTLLPEAALRPPTLGDEFWRTFASVWTDPADAARKALLVGGGLLLPYLGGLALVAWVVVAIARKRRRGPTERPV